jgi:prepilin-type processing-associated H-X9-DG protein
MDDPSESVEVKRRRTSLRLIEVVVILLVIGVLVALCIPATERAREAARRICCNNQLKMLALAALNYEQTNHCFPAGTICNSKPIQPGNQYDVWGEAGRTGPEDHGTSFLLALLPYVEESSTFSAWASGKKESGTTAGCWSPAANLGTRETLGPAMMDIKTFYCPTRRSGLRPQDRVMMLSSDWTGGGTDYGGCAGRYAAFTLETGYNLCDASIHYDPEFQPEGFRITDPDEPKKHLGIFGRVNVNTTFGEITDGISNTFLVGELQRITDSSPESKDGWSVGGPATLFTTGAMISKKDTNLMFVDSPTTGKLSNNGFFGSPGSEHQNGANYGLGDGSVKFFSSSMDSSTFALIGSMSDHIPLSPCPID